MSIVLNTAILKKPLHSVGPLDEKVVFCLKPKDWKVDKLISGPWVDARYSTAALEFPPDVHDLFFISRGLDREAEMGSIGFTALPDRSDRVRAVLINYSAAPRLDDILDVCLLERGDGQYGIGFLV